MTNVLVQEALRSGAETLETLEQKYAISAKRHGYYPNLVLLKYDQIASQMGNPLVQQCRGIILDEDDNWRVVARPFDKFFNLGEPNCAQIDWATARPLEKLDGSLAILYYYDGQWHMATSGTPDASGPVGNLDKTFKDLFWQTWYDAGYTTDSLDRDFTWMFELMTPENRIVVPHSRYSLKLIGVRHRVTGEEIDIRDPKYNLENDFEVVQEFPYKSPEALLTSFENMDGLMQEGYVVVDAKFNRVKIKHPRYVLFHQMVGSLTKKKVLDAVRRGESPEILTYFPTWAAEFEAMKAKLDFLVGVYENAYEGLISYKDQPMALKDIPVQKDFALAIKDIGLPTGPFFAVRSGKSKSFRDYFSTLRLEALADMIGIKDADVVSVEVPNPL